METFRFKPVSKNALIRCVEQEYHGRDAKGLVEAIRKVDFGGVLIDWPEPDMYDDRTFVGTLTPQSVPEFDSYCCYAVRAAICAVLDDVILQRFPFLEFTSIIRLEEQTA